MRPLMSILRTTAIVAGKDLRLEWRNRSRILSIVLFGLVTLLLLSMALGPDTPKLRAAAAGCLTVALLFGSTLGLAESFRIEREDQALEGLALLPIDPLGVYFGKLLANTIFLWSLAVVLVPTTVILFAVEVDVAGALGVVGLWLLAAIGIAAPGTLYAAMTSQLRSQDVMLPLLLFPLEVPVLMATVKSFDLLFTGDPMQQLGSWSGLLIAFDVIFVCVCGLLFPLVFEQD